VAERQQPETVLLRSEPMRSSTPVIDPRVAWLITDILSDDAARAPAFGRGSVLSLSRPAAVKTGTTTDWRDNWTIGYTPDLATGVWVGNADNSAMEQVSGVTGAGPIWHDLMEKALLGRPERGFDQPAGLVQAEVCALSGKLPTEACPHRSIEWFIAGTTPTELDDWYQVLQLDQATGLVADAQTPASRIVEKTYLVLPPELQEWARDQGIPAPPPNSAIVTGGAGESNAALLLVSPDPGVAYRISPAVPREQQQIRFSAVARVALTEKGFVLDGERLRVQGNSFELQWALEAGRHRVQAWGTTPDGEELQSAVVEFSVLEEGS
jgi:membrane carboxypeptidase/penicillin-binding protein PbpC